MFDVPPILGFQSNTCAVFWRVYKLVVFHLLYTRLLGGVWFLFCVGSLRVFDGTEKWFPWLGSIAEEVVNRKL